jgi:hypothetical protein
MKIYSYLYYIQFKFINLLNLISRLDRMLSITNPTRFLIRKNKKFQITLSVLIILFNIFYYTPVIVAKEYKPRNMTVDNYTASYKCYYNDPAGTIHWMDFFNSTVFPFVCMLLFTSMTIIALFKSRRRHAKRRASLYDNINTVATAASNNETVTINKANIDHAKRKRDIKFALTSIALNLCFLVFNLPIVIFNLIMSYYIIAKDDYIFYFSIVDLLYYTNFGSLCYISFLVNSIFKEELRKMIAELFSSF